MVLKNPEPLELVELVALVVVAAVLLVSVLVAVVGSLLVLGSEAVVENVLNAPDPLAVLGTVVSVTASDVANVLVVVVAFVVVAAVESDGLGPTVEDKVVVDSNVPDPLIALADVVDE